MTRLNVDFGLKICGLWIELRIVDFATPGRISRGEFCLVAPLRPPTGGRFGVFATGHIFCFSPRTSGSTDSNYRAACRARTRKEFISKLGVVVEESDESLGWLRLLIETSICATDSAKALAHEADELVAIFVQSEKTAKRNYEAEQARRRATVKRKSRSRS